VELRRNFGMDTSQEAGRADYKDIVAPAIFFCKRQSSSDVAGLKDRYLGSLRYATVDVKRTLLKGRYCSMRILGRIRTKLNGPNC